MIPTRAASTAAATLLLAGLTAVGCASKTETTLAPPPPEPATQASSFVHSDARERIQSVVARAEEYEKGAAVLPGPNQADDRAQVVKELALLSQILPVIAGPDTSGDFRQELRILD